MICDHIGKVCFPSVIQLQIIGRLCLPMIVYKLVKGYNQTHDIKKYVKRLYLLGLISQPLYYNLIDVTCLNICFTLCLCLILLYCIENRNEFVFIKLLILFSYDVFFDIEYGVYALILTFICKYIHQENVYIGAFVAFLFLNLYTIHFGGYTEYQMYSCVGLLIIFLIKNHRDCSMKYRINYLIYPVHLIILYIIEQCT